MLLKPLAGLFGFEGGLLIFLNLSSILVLKMEFTDGLVIGVVINRLVLGVGRGVPLGDLGVQSDKKFYKRNVQLCLSLSFFTIKISTVNEWIFFTHITCHYFVPVSWTLTNVRINCLKMYCGIIETLCIICFKSPNIVNIVNTCLYFRNLQNRVTHHFFCLVLFLNLLVDIVTLSYMDISAWNRNFGQAQVLMTSLRVEILTFNGKFWSYLNQLLCKNIIFSTLWESRRHKAASPRLA